MIISADLAWEATQNKKRTLHLHELQTHKKNETTAHQNVKFEAEDSEEKKYTLGWRRFWELEYSELSATIAERCKMFGSLDAEPDPCFFSFLD